MGDDFQGAPDSQAYSTPLGVSYLNVDSGKILCLGLLSIATEFSCYGVLYGRVVLRKDLNLIKM